MTSLPWPSFRLGDIYIGLVAGAGGSVRKTSELRAELVPLAGKMSLSNVLQVVLDTGEMGSSYVMFLPAGAFEFSPSHIMV